MRGRKTTQESRATEFRQRLVAWNQTPKSLRPSLRALARELGTSHQLLKHYLDGLEKWRYKERYRQATEESDQILARAIVEDRAMTQWEIERHRVCTITAMRAKLASLMVDELASLKRATRRSSLNPAQLKLVKILAKRRFPGAQVLLDNLSQSDARNCNDNLPVISAGAVKSFRTVQAKAEEDWQLR
jgi:hypothetical protein